MAKIGNYCKAYKIGKLREFAGWTSNDQNARKERREQDGVEIEMPRELTDGDFLYVQENLVVTDGVYLDENIIYDDITPEWKDFCEKELKFEVPDYSNKPQETISDLSNDTDAQ